MSEQDGPSGVGSAPPPPWAPPESPWGLSGPSTAELPPPPPDPLLLGWADPSAPPAWSGLPLPAREPARTRPGRGRLLGLLLVMAVLLGGVAVAVRVPGHSPLAPAAGSSAPGADGADASSSGAAGAGAAAQGSGPVGYQAFDDGARQILSTLSGALAAHDPTRFASVVPRGYSALRTRLGRLYTNLSSLPIASITLRLDAASDSRPVSRPEPEARTLPVVASYRYKGWDATEVDARLLFVAARAANGGWQLVDDRTTATGGVSTRLEPWAFDDVYVTSTPHVLVLGDTSHRQQARRLASTLEQLTADVHRVWPEPSWNGKIVAYAMTSPAFVRSWYGHSAAGDPGNGDRASFVAKVAALPPSAPGDAHRVVRMVVTPYLLSSTASAYTDVLRHEVTHVATAGLPPDAPVWLVEGAAEYTGFARRSSGDLDATRTFGEHGLTAAEVTATERGTWRPTLVTGDSFYQGSEKTVDERYNSAFITCLYIADHFGDASLRRFYEQASTGDTTKALRTVLHTDQSHLVAAVGSYATTLRRRLVFR